MSSISLRELRSKHMAKKRNEAAQNFLHAQRKYENAEAELERLFKRAVEEVLPDTNLAFQIIAKMPDCISKVFLLDKIRQTKVRNHG